jgi:hypothetical protein
MGVFSTTNVLAGTALTTNFSEVVNKYTAVTVASTLNGGKPTFNDWQEQSNRATEQKMCQHQLDPHYTLSVDRWGMVDSYAVAITEIYDLKSHPWLGMMNGVHPGTVARTGQSACALSNVQEFTDTGVFITTKKIMAGLELIWDYGRKFDWDGSTPEDVLPEGDRACACQWPTKDGKNHYFNGILTTTTSHHLSFSDGTTFAVTNFDVSAADNDATGSYGGYDNLVINYCN